MSPLARLRRLGRLALLIALLQFMLPLAQSWATGLASASEGPPGLLCTAAGLQTADAAAAQAPVGQTPAHDLAASEHCTCCCAAPADALTDSASEPGLPAARPVHSLPRVLALAPPGSPLPASAPPRAPPFPA